MVTAIFVQNILRPLLDRSLAQKQGRVYVYFHIDGNDLMHCHILFSFVPMAMSLCALSFNNQTVNWLPQTEKGICIVKADCSPVFSVPVLTLICANTFECARTRVDRRHDLHQRAPYAQTGQTGYGDRSDRFYRERREDLKPRAREGPRRSSWI